MIRFVIRLYDYMVAHKLVCALSFVVVTLTLIVSLTQLNYKEDISDFLPVSGKEKEALSVYQDISGANRIFIIFEQKGDSASTNPELIIDAIKAYESLIKETDSLHFVNGLTTQIDLDEYTELIDYIYSHVPYFLTPKDYVRLDSLLNTEDYIGKQLATDKEMLLFPSSSILAENISRDPLNLFTPILSSLQTINTTSSFETYDGYIFTPDMQKAIVMMHSPFGNSETQNNALLVNYLSSVADSLQSLYPNVSAHPIGGPVIAVGNASQIKHDSILSASIAIILILLLLSYTLKRFRNLFLIAVSILWGWIFALGMLSFVHDNISLIVVGISSIILGIAINYPLHLIAHLSSATSVRAALREVASPLIIGNITTVGAFLALIPLDAVALRDLGLFSTFLLIGTILFVIMYLPHVVGHKGKFMTEEESKTPFKWISNLSVEATPSILLVLLVLTAVLGYFSMSTHFDANMANINYMSDEQRKDMHYFQQLTSGNDSLLECVYVVSEASSLDEALSHNTSIQDSLARFINPEKGEKLYSCSRFFCSKDEQFKRLSLWNNFITTHKDKLWDEFKEASHKEGFAEEAFSPYFDMLNTKHCDTLSETPLLEQIFNSYISMDTLAHDYKVVDMLLVDKKRADIIEKKIESWDNPHYFSFDIKSMNSALANHLSDNFNYIGWACGIIVFLFLWFSFGKIELAMLSFLPMAVSWLWILGIMSIFDIHFNIVNIILATFIFGQGDDYTIFIAEGCCYEYAYRKKLLASYKSSIIISALIMFIGIGSLIFAKHPALHSLAEVTIIGMFSVVLMAFTLPPIVFNWMVKIKGSYRRRPLTLPALTRTWLCGIWWLSQLCLGYIFGGILLIFGRKNAIRQTALNKFVSWIHRMDQHIIPGVRYSLRNPYKEDFQKPAIIICNHQSMLDPMCLMALSHKIRIVANKHSSLNPVIRFMFRWLGFYTINQNNFKAWQDSSLQRDIHVFRQYVEKGYSIAIFPEGTRNASSSILRYRKGAFYLAHELGIDILPVIIHGMNNIMPLHSFMTHPGKLTVCIEQRITPSSPLWGATYAETTKRVHRTFISNYEKMCKELENTSYYRKLVLERYIYKGTDVYRAVKSNLKRYNNYAQWVDNLPSDIHTVYVKNSGYGEFPLLLALVNPHISVIASEPDDEKRTLAFYSADGIAFNLSYRNNFDIFEAPNNKSKMIVYDATNLNVKYE